MTCEYVLFDLVIFLCSTAGYFLYPSRARIHLKSAVKAISFIALPFMLVDWIVTNWFWQFNPKYILGIFVMNLPIEELLFFFVIPWACLILWVNIIGKKQSLDLTLGGWVVKLLSLLLIMWGFLGQRWYSVLITAVFLILSLRISWRSISKRLAVFTLVTFGLTLIFNMYLTARPVVIYNPSLIAGLHIGTIPIEDFLYGIVLNLSVVTLYERFTNSDLNH